MAAVVLEGENPKLIGQHSVVDGVWKARHNVVSDICFRDSPPLGSFLDSVHGSVDRFEKLSAESRDALFVKLSCLNQLPFGLWVVI